MYQSFMCGGVTAKGEENMFGNYPMAQQNLNYVFGFVHGMRGAESFYVPANCGAILFDLDAQIFYFKRCDQFGVSYPITVCEYAVKAPVQQNVQFDPTKVESPVYDAKAEIDALTKRVAVLEGGKADV